MPYYEFANTDVIDYTIKVYPKHKFFIYGSSSFHNNKVVDVGSFNSKPHTLVTHVNKSGSLSLYELNIDRPSGSLSYPFVTKQGSLHSFKTVSKTKFATEFGYGDQISGRYPLSASIRHEYYPRDTNSPPITRRRVHALANPISRYSFFSKVYTVSGSSHNLYSDKINIVSIPSIYYGSSLKRGSVSLGCYVTGSLIAEVRDINQNGELIQVGPTGSAASGSVAGFVLYNEGVIILTGSTDLSAGTFTDRYDGSTPVSPQWTYWGISPQFTQGGALKDGDLGNGHVSSSWSLSFEGLSYIPVKMMFAHAPKNDLNFSSNPTFISKADRISSGSFISEYSYEQSEKISHKNVVSSSFATHEETFEKQTYISKIGIYDEHRNLIGIAKLANPLKKTEDREFVFKLKIDF